MNIQQNISLLKDILQIIFFIIAGAVTILTYFLAKRTLFQPLRTEVFKEQLKIFSELLTLFSGKGEIELRQLFDLEVIFRNNSVKLLDEYLLIFHRMTQNFEDRPYNKPRPASSIVKRKYLASADNTHRPEKDSGQIANKYGPDAWKEYEYYQIYLTDAFNESIAALQKYIDSPLVPSDLLQELEELVKIVQGDIEKIFTVLDEIALDLTNTYPTVNDVTSAELSWMYNKYNTELDDIEPKVKKIITYLRKYYDSDKLNISNKKSSEKVNLVFRHRRT